MTNDMIVEAVRSVRMSPADQAVVMGSAQPAASPAAVERFQAVMASEEVVAPTAAVPFADEVSRAWRSAQADHQGILHRMRALSELNGKEGVTAASLLEMQYDVANLAFQQEVVSKVADKSSNAIQTLIKNQ